MLQKPTTSQEESVSLQKSSLTDSSTQSTCYQLAIERWKAGSFRVTVWERESSWAQMDVLFKTFKKKKRKHGHKANGTAGIKQHRSNCSSSFVMHSFLLFTCVYGAIFMVIYSARPALLCESSVCTAAAWKALAEGPGRGSAHCNVIEQPIKRQK